MTSQKDEGRNRWRQPINVADRQPGTLHGRRDGGTHHLGQRCGLKIQWNDGEQVTWRRDSLAERPIVILDAVDQEEDATVAIVSEADIKQILSDGTQGAEPAVSIEPMLLTIAPDPAHSRLPFPSRAKDASLLLYRTHLVKNLLNCRKSAESQKIQKRGG